MDKLGQRERQRQKNLLKGSFRLMAPVEAKIARGSTDEATRIAVAYLREHAEALQKMLRLDAERFGPQFGDEELDSLVAELDSRVAAMESRTVREWH